MRKALVLIENIAKQSKAPGDVKENIEFVRELFQGLLEASGEGEA